MEESESFEVLMHRYDQVQRLIHANHLLAQAGRAVSEVMAELLRETGRLEPAPEALPCNAVRFPGR